MIKLSNLFGCPKCKGELIIIKHKYICNSCKDTYQIISEIPIFLSDDKSNSYSKYWDKGWKNRSDIGDQNFHKKPKSDYYEDIKNVLLKVKEIKSPVTSINMQKENETLLNIGCGMMEAPVIIMMGINNYIGIDFSYTAVKSSLESIKKLNGHGVTLQANAESLPIKSETIDQVYSAGVLHHTPNIETTFDEIYRVLKPSGRGIIGLYRTYSLKFIVAKVIGTLEGLLSKKGYSWYAFTEGSWKTDGLSNPWSKTFSKKQIISMLKKYNYLDINFRVIGFNWGDCVPIIGKHFQKTRLGKKSASLLKEKLGGMLVVTFVKPQD